MAYPTTTISHHIVPYSVKIFEELFTLLLKRAIFKNSREHFISTGKYSSLQKNIFENT